jgi:hypothetical protein
MGRQTIVSAGRPRGRLFACGWGVQGVSSFPDTGLPSKGEDGKEGMGRPHEGQRPLSLVGPR